MPSSAESILEALPIPAIIVGPDSVILASNKPAHSVFGVAEESQHITTMLRYPQVLDALDGVLSDQEARSVRFQFGELESDGIYDTSLTTIIWENTQAVLICFQDMTQQEQAGQMRRDFVANVSHELRTPLTAMMGFIETLRGAGREDVEARERFLKIMESEAARMNRLVGDLLSLSWVEAQERSRPKARVDIVSVVSSSIHTLQQFAQEHEVALHFAKPFAEQFLPGDSDQLLQVFHNLIENAIKYGGQGGDVCVTIIEPQYDPRLGVYAVHTLVQDNGLGIAAEHIPRLTERFYRVDTHRSREMGGTGLGLAIVKHIVNRHRGYLRIESEGKGGSQFTICLPLS